MGETLWNCVPVSNNNALLNAEGVGGLSGKQHGYTRHHSAINIVQVTEFVNAEQQKRHNMSVVILVVLNMKTAFNGAR